MPRARNHSAALVIAGLAILSAPDAGQAAPRPRAPSAALAPGSTPVFSDEMRAIARRADFTADGRLDQEDVRRLLSARATRCPQTMTDINGDNAFDQKDLADLLHLIASGIRPDANPAALDDAGGAAPAPARLMAIVDRN